ncbi:alpha/beta-Hydrolases superfamily protein [Rhynchospora pubera]|uniref:Alpha/beta-Hydrolases superfamily protein n=1 Tax=Rhynchospora pubera TaxID=906938 RepID=A0AAV8DQX8_9POAL|nr:alpha/beta-Hydrolases superfamily protein [Rhynchospora pubera]
MVVSKPSFASKLLPTRLSRRDSFSSFVGIVKLLREKSKRQPMTSEGKPKWDPAVVDDNLARLVAQANFDDVSERRRVREAFKEVQLGLDHCLFKAKYTGIKTNESYERNSRGLEVFSKSWLPETSNIKALVFFCHGYGDTCTFFFEGIAKKIASAGYGVFALDYPGFGLSEGLHGYIPSFNAIVDDVVEHFSKIRENPEYRGKPCFLFGQSLGGAVALKVHFKQPDRWDGAILVAPMCKIADGVAPPWALQQILILVAKFLPKEKLVPQKDLADLALKETKKRDQCAYNVIAYKDKPRLGTALELLRTTQEIERRLEEVTLPLLILHGEADVVTDPSVSKALYEKAKSSDKKLCLYKDAWHSLLEGESDDTIFRALDDIISWLDSHSERNPSS